MNLFRDQIYLKIFVVSGINILAINAISVMVFGSLGKTSANSGWNYVLTLYCFLAVISLSYYLSSTKKLQSSWFSAIATLLSGALLGFYYGGITTDNNPQIATISAIALSMIFGICFWQKYQLLSVIVPFIAAIAAYGFAFFAGTQALSLLNVAAIIPGIIWSILCLIYLIITLDNFSKGIHLIRKPRHSHSK